MKNILEMGTPLIIRVSENFNAKNMSNTVTISSIVGRDVYSADGSRILINAGTPAFIGFHSESNGTWGKAGKIYLTHAITKTVDNKRVSVRLSSCKNGKSRLAWVILLSLFFFPLGLLSGCIKGSMPKIRKGTTYNAYVMQDVMVE